jgi:hypothetical protein
VWFHTIFQDQIMIWNLLLIEIRLNMSFHIRIPEFQENQYRSHWKNGKYIRDLLQIKVTFQVNCNLALFGVWSISLIWLWRNSIFLSSNIKFLSIYGHFFLICCRC